MFVGKEKEVMWLWVKRREPRRGERGRDLGWERDNSSDNEEPCGWVVGWDKRTSRGRGRNRREKEQQEDEDDEQGRG